MITSTEGNPVPATAMPHIWIEYSGNLDLDTRALMRTVQDAAIGDGSLFPLAGARTAPSGSTTA